MQDRKFALFGIVVFCAGLLLSLQALRASHARDAFDADQTAKSKIALPTDDEDRAALDQHMQLNHTAQTWWIIASVLAGSGLLLTLIGLLGKPAPKSPAA